MVYSQYFCFIHFCFIHLIFKEIDEVTQSVIQNFAWYKVSYLQWHKVSYYFIQWRRVSYSWILRVACIGFGCLTRSRIVIICGYSTGRRLVNRSKRSLRSCATWGHSGQKCIQFWQMAKIFKLGVQTKSKFLSLRHNKVCHRNNNYIWIPGHR